MGNKKLKCCLCGEAIKPNALGWDQGNNAEPLKQGRCCDNCNMMKVIPARIEQLGHRYSPDLND